MRSRCAGHIGRRLNCQRSIIDSSSRQSANAITTGISGGCKTGVANRMLAHTEWKYCIATVIRVRCPGEHGGATGRTLVAGEAKSNWPLRCVITAGKQRRLCQHCAMTPTLARSHRVDQHCAAPHRSQNSTVLVLPAAVLIYAGYTVVCTHVFIFMGVKPPATSTVPIEVTPPHNIEHARQCVCSWPCEQGDWLYLAHNDQFMQMIRIFWPAQTDPGHIW